MGACGSKNAPEQPAAVQSASPAPAPAILLGKNTPVPKSHADEKSDLIISVNQPNECEFQSIKAVADEQPSAESTACATGGSELQGTEADFSGFSVGEQVDAMRHFYANSREILEGERGVIVKLDEDNDALVEFPAGVEWISQACFSHLRGAGTAPSSTEAESRADPTPCARSASPTSAGDEEEQAGCDRMRLASPSSCRAEAEDTASGALAVVEVCVDESPHLRARKKFACWC